MLVILIGSVIQVLDLEGRVSAQGDSSMSARPGAKEGDSRNIPRAPPKAALSGHRAPVTAVAVHPIYR